MRKLFAPLFVIAVFFAGVGFVRQVVSPPVVEAHPPSACPTPAPASPAPGSGRFFYSIVYLEGAREGDLTVPADDADQAVARAKALVGPGARVRSVYEGDEINRPRLRPQGSGE